MKTKALIYRFSGLFLFILLLSSCSKDDDGLFTGSDASYEITVSGAESMNMTGSASFVQVVVNSADPGSSGTSLTITLSNDDNTNTSGNALVISMTKNQSDGFSERTYNFIEDPGEDDVFLSMSFYSEESSTTYFLKAGSVTLEKLSKNRVKGSVNAQFSDTNEEAITVSGSFDAYGISQGWGI